MHFEKKGLSVTIPPCMIFILCFMFNVCYAETIKLKNGRTFTGPIIERSSDYIVIFYRNVPLKYHLDQIESIKENEGIDMNDPDVSKSYLSENSLIREAEVLIREFEDILGTYESMLMQANSRERCSKIFLECLDKHEALHQKLNQLVEKYEKEGVRLEGCPYKSPYKSYFNKRFAGVSERLQAMNIRCQSLH